MNNKFFRCIAAMMAFMMLFANVALADGEEPYTFEETSTDNADFIHQNIKDKLEMVDIDGEILYKYVFKVPTTNLYDILSSEWSVAKQAEFVYLDKDKDLYTGFFNIYINDGSTTPIEKSFAANNYEGIWARTEKSY